MFRFQTLEIWRLAADLAGELCDIADELETRRLYRFAEQLRAAALSASNNIAEGSGSASTADFRRYLNIARCSTFENASMILLYTRRGYLTEARCESLLMELDRLCRMITSFSNSLGHKRRN